MPHLVPINEGDSFVYVRLSQRTYVEPADIHAVGLEFLEIRDNPAVVINCSTVEYMGSGFLGKLITLGRYMKMTNRRLILCNIQPDVLEVLRIIGLANGDLFTICTDVDSARGLIIPQVTQ